MTALSHSPVCNIVLCLGPFAVLPTLDKTSYALPSPPMGLLNAPFVVSALPLQSPPLPLYDSRSLTVALVSIFPFPPEGAAYIGPNSGLECVPVTLWWGVMGFPWPVGTTSGH